jgi:tRNA A-37 threonylcarbamoyl transferase component Bud32
MEGNDPDAAARDGHVTTPPSQLPYVPELDPALARDLPVVPLSQLVPEKFLAMGGMGEVIEAEDVPLLRRIAKKTLHLDLQADIRSQRMLIREARVTGQLEHPNIIPVHDLGVDCDGRLFFTMKKVDGRTLLDVVRELPPGPFDHTTLLNLIDIVVKVCDALALAHSRGVVHCDLKASNVMVGEYGQVYLMDWGVARVLGKAHTRDGIVPVHDGLPPAASGDEDDSAISGTPSHMAPEQAQSDIERIGPRTDVFAVGALLYEIVTGEAPYRADIIWALLLKAAASESEPFEDSVRGATLAPMLGTIIRRAMQRDPDERYPTIIALRADLVRFMRGEADFPRTHFAAGSTIVSEGEQGEAAFRILEGECDVFRGRGPDQVFVRTMSAGETFGEMAILSPGPRTATVVARTEVLAEVVTATVFLRELGTMKPWLASVVRTLADRFRERGL